MSKLNETVNIKDKVADQNGPTHYHLDLNLGLSEYDPWGGYGSSAPRNPKQTIRIKVRTPIDVNIRELILDTLEQAGFEMDEISQFLAHKSEMVDAKVGDKTVRVHPMSMERLTGYKFVTKSE